MHTSDDEAKGDISQALELELSSSESEGKAEIFSPRRTRKKRKEPVRKANSRINYKGIFAMFGSEANISPGSSYSIYESDTAFLCTLDLTASAFKPTSVTIDSKKHVYSSKDNTYEHTLHPLVFTAKSQAHQSNSPIYSDILHCLEYERNMWDIVIVKDL